MKILKIAYYKTFSKPYLSRTQIVEIYTTKIPDFSYALCSFEILTFLGSQVSQIVGDLEFLTHNLEFLRVSFKKIA